MIYRLQEAAVELVEEKLRKLGRGLETFVDNRYEVCELKKELKDMQDSYKNITAHYYTEQEKTRSLEKRIKELEPKKKKGNKKREDTGEVWCCREARETGVCDC